MLTLERDDELVRVLPDPALDDGQRVNEDACVQYAELFATAVTVSMFMSASCTPAAPATPAVRAVAAERERVDRALELLDLVREERGAHCFRELLALCSEARVSAGSTGRPRCMLGVGCGVAVRGRVQDAHLDLFWCCHCALLARSAVSSGASTRQVAAIWWSQAAPITASAT